MLTNQIKSIDLLSVVQREGIQLTSRGKYHTGLCPFHSEKSPSFIVNTDKNRFNCYGCHEFGDPVDFIQKYHAFTFPEALSYLGIESRPTTKEQFGQLKKRIKDAERRRERREAREQREQELCFTLGTLIRRIEKACSALTPDNLYVLGGILDPLAWYTWAHDTLIHGNKEEKAHVLFSFRGFPAIKRRQLFRKGFDFEQWLRGFLKNGADGNGETKEAG